MSIFAKKATMIWDLSGQIFSAQPALEQEVAVEYDIDMDPIAYILERRSGSDFASNRKYVNKAMYEELANEFFDKKVIDPKYNEQAKLIRDHYRKKIFMVTMKKQEVSSFREVVDEIILEPTRLKVSQIPVLLRLPDFYQEDLDMQDLLDNYTSAKSGTSFFDMAVEFDGEVQFVKSVNRYGKRADRIRYYFKTEENSLICIVVDQANNLRNLMSYFADKNKTFRLRGPLISSKETGYQDFKFYYTCGSNYEIY